MKQFGRIGLNENFSYLSFRSGVVRGKGGGEGVVGGGGAVPIPLKDRVVGGGGGGAGVGDVGQTLATTEAANFLLL
ncbi:hypothetical protein JCGZ_19522 [Jatropha curcas]|uniref:Uncharacterized protein n=1 Tax=Jatropha curcas TaxID=180498 RepID=A0A067KAV8_JATCU|nr:hypothetical protein JCGZ_19522 [Jatropha curcas]